MKDLKIKGVEALDAKELRKVEGGIAPWVVFVGGALLGWALSQDIDAMVDSFNEGYNRARR